MLFRLLKKYKESEHVDPVFNVYSIKPGSNISDYSKIPPLIFEWADIRGDDSINLNNTIALRRRLEYYEKIPPENGIELLLNACNTYY